MGVMSQEDRWFTAALLCAMIVGIALVGWGAPPEGERPCGRGAFGRPIFNCDTSTPAQLR